MKNDIMAVFFNIKTHDFINKRCVCACIFLFLYMHG